MKINDKLQQIVSKIEGLSFEYNDYARFNKKTTQIKMPVCFVQTPFNGTIKNKNGRLKDIVNVTVCFLDLAELDFEGNKNEYTIEEMKSYAKRFIWELNKSNLFKPLPENVLYHIYYNKLNDNLTGVELDLQLEELTGICL